LITGFVGRSQKKRVREKYLRTGNLLDVRELKRRKGSHGYEHPRDSRKDLQEEAGRGSSGRSSGARLNSEKRIIASRSGHHYRGDQTDRKGRATLRFEMSAF